jgi:hypothetical protein
VSEPLYREIYDGIWEDATRAQISRSVTLADVPDFVEALRQDAIARTSVMGDTE